MTWFGLPAAKFLLELNLKISPVDRASQYHTLKNEMRDSRIRQLTEPKSGLSLGPEVIFFLGLDFIYCFLSTINVKLPFAHDACPSLLVWCHG